MREMLLQTCGDPQQFIAAFIAERYNITVMLDLLACRIADNTEIGIASFNAQEKSTIRTDSAFVTFRVKRYVAAVPSNVYGTSLSARWDALLSREDLSFSDSSIIVTTFSYRLEPPT